MPPIAYGLRQMQRSKADRQPQATLAEQRHEENMLALTDGAPAMSRESGFERFSGVYCRTHEGDYVCPVRG